MKIILFVLVSFILAVSMTNAQNYWQATASFPNFSGIYGNSFATDYISTGRIVIGGHGNCGCIFRSLDGGNSWENLNSPPGTVLNMSIYPWTPNWLLAAVNTSGSSGGLYRYYNTPSGFVWGSVSMFDGKDVRTVLAKNYLFAGLAGDPTYRGIWKSLNDEGTSWTRVESGYEIYCMFTKNGKYYAGGYNPNLSNGILLKSDDLGVSWIPVADFTNRVIGITVADSNNIFVAWGTSTAKISASINGAPFSVVYNLEIPFVYYKLPMVTNSLGHVFFGARLQGVIERLIMD